MDSVNRIRNIEKQIRELQEERERLERDSQLMLSAFYNVALYREDCYTTPVARAVLAYDDRYIRFTDCDVKFDDIDKIINWFTNLKNRRVPFNTLI